MTTTVTWTPVADGYPPPYAACLVVAGGAVVGGVLFEWSAARRRWDDHAGRFEQVRQDVTHWAEVAKLKVEGPA